MEGGCVTKVLWQNNTFEAYNEPAAHSNLRLYLGADQTTDLLVVYTEVSERHDGLRTRAYWLNDNQRRVTKHLPPHFTSAHSERSLQAVPIFYEPTPQGAQFPEGFSAVLSSNEQSFTLYCTNRQIGTYDLPTYSDGKGKIERIALTPLAAAADLTIVGGAVGGYFCALYAKSISDAQKP